MYSMLYVARFVINLVASQVGTFFYFLKRRHPEFIPPTPKYHIKKKKNRPENFTKILIVIGIPKYAAL